MKGREVMGRGTRSRRVRLAQAPGRFGSLLLFRDDDVPNVRSTATEAPWKGVDLCDGTVYHWRPAGNTRATNSRQGVDDVLQG